MEYLKATAGIQHQTLTYYEARSKNFLLASQIPWETSAVTAIHKAYQNSASQLNAERTALQEVAARESALAIAWKKYVECFVLVSRFSPEAVRVNSGESKPQLLELANTCLVPLVKEKAGVKENCKLIQCIEFTKSMNRRPQSTSMHRKSQVYEVLSIASSKKEAIELHHELLKSYNLKTAGETAGVEKTSAAQLLSRSRIHFLGSSSLAPYNGFIYCCESEALDNATKETMANIKDIQCTAAGASVILPDDTHIQLLVCTFNDLLRHKKVVKNAPGKLHKHIRGKEIKRMYVLDTLALDFLCSSEEPKILLRKLSGTEIAELLFSYTGILIPAHMRSIDKLYADLYSDNTIFGWIKDNTANRQFLAALQKVQPSDTNASKHSLCRWPSCLSLSCCNARIKALSNCSLASLEVIPVSFNNPFTNNFSHFEMILSTLSLYKVKGTTKEITNDTRKAKLEHFCLLHTMLAISLAKVARFYLYSVYSQLPHNNSEHFKGFEDVLTRKREASDLDTLFKIKPLKDSIKALIKITRSVNGRRGNRSVEQMQKSAWTSKLRFQGIALTRYAPSNIKDRREESE